MGSVMKALESITNKISDFLGAMGGVLVMLLMLLITFGAISRYGFGSAHGWITDISGYSMLVIAFLGAAQVQKNHGHVSVDLFVNKLGKTGQDVLGIFVSAVCALLSLVLFWFGVTDVMEKIQEHALLVGTINVPEYYILMFLPLGFLLLTSYFLRDIAVHVHNIRNGAETKN